MYVYLEVVYIASTDTNSLHSNSDITGTFKFTETRKSTKIDWEFTGIWKWVSKKIRRERDYWDSWEWGKLDRYQEQEAWMVESWGCLSQATKQPDSLLHHLYLHVTYPLYPFSFCNSLASSSSSLKAIYEMKHRDSERNNRASWLKLIGTDCIIFAGRSFSLLKYQ